jgi:Mg2+-importing ATPase
MFMLKNITRQLFAAEPPPATPSCSARSAAKRQKLAGRRFRSLTERCLNVAAMDENEVWRAFGSHPEGLNAAKWKNPRRAWR